MNKIYFSALSVLLLAGCSQGSQTPEPQPVVEVVPTPTETPVEPEVVAEPTFEWGTPGIYSIKKNEGQDSEASPSARYSLHYQSTASEPIEEIYSFVDLMEDIYFVDHSIFYLAPDTLVLKQFNVLTGEESTIDTSQGLNDGTWSAKVGVMMGGVLDLIQTNEEDLVVLQWQSNDRCSPIGNFRIETPEAYFNAFTEAGADSVNIPEFGPSPSTICYNKLTRINPSPSENQNVYPKESANTFISRLPIFTTGDFPKSGNRLEILEISEADETIRLYWQDVTPGEGPKSALVYDYYWPGDDIKVIETLVDIPLVESNGITPESTTAKRAFEEKYLGASTPQTEWQAEFDGDEFVVVTD